MAKLYYEANLQDTNITITILQLTQIQLAKKQSTKFKGNLFFNRFIHDNKDRKLTFSRQNFSIVETKYVVKTFNVIYI